MTIAYGYGKIWHRPGLNLRQRAMVSLAGFTALQLQDQLKKFAQSARNIGLTLDEATKCAKRSSSRRPIAGTRLRSMRCGG